MQATKAQRQRVWNEKDAGWGMVKYAVLVKHFARDISDVRIEIINVPREVDNFGPFEATALIRETLLGPFEVVAVTDRIAERNYEPENSLSQTAHKEKE